MGKSTTSKWLVPVDFNNLNLWEPADYFSLVFTGPPVFGALTLSPLTVTRLKLQLRY